MKPASLASAIMADEDMIVNPETTPRKRRRSVEAVLAVTETEKELSEWARKGQRRPSVLETMGMVRPRPKTPPTPPRGDDEEIVDRGRDAAPAAEDQLSQWGQAGRRRKSVLESMRPKTPPTPPMGAGEGRAEGGARAVSVAPIVIKANRRFCAIS